MMRTIFLYTILTLVVSLTANAGTDCENALTKLGPHWKFDKISVPFNWNDPQSEKIEVTYYYKDQFLYQDLTPIIFFNGGPTMAGHSAISGFDKIKGMKQQNIIFLDQRGTGCSTPFKTYNQHTDIGVFKNYSSDSIVRDAEVIREKLFGNKKWKVFGQSYGGLISFRYLQMFPESIESAHIHGFGFWKDSSQFLDLREKSIAKFTPEILNYKNSKTSDLTIGEIIQGVKNLEPDKKVIFDAICIDTPGAWKNKFCGEDIFTGLYMITGFKNFWSTAHKYLFNILQLNLEGSVEELSTYFKRFANIYMLRFNDPNQSAVLHAITYNEMIPGKLNYDGCQENDLISECRFKKNFMPRLFERPQFNTNPVNYATVRNNIKAFNISVFYYAGAYDSFLPVEILRYTASFLGIEDSFHVFPNSGHEGYSTEKLVIDNIIHY